ncbi:RsmB/NOP family class I SAM-dependent RNA methyltransferase [Sporichthya polymorpha]|uniref:RsmB/NOP family class I SAM-dependent RNA methyltransferase n=1 Tax=Sporichthya polymorpha TaxID=35751 RepID=UPI00037EADD5|nr:transcription antitermination factor NusB [Sporichthya polymorpha]
MNDDPRGRSRRGGRPASRSGDRPRSAPRSPRNEPADPARRAALDLLRAVADRDAYANLVLPGLLRERGLTGRDAAFATELGYGTLRAQGTYDAVLAACVDRPLEKLDPGVVEVLRLGAHQLLGLQTPPHAAVSATVALCRAAVGPGPAGLVNAVLRKVSARDLDAWVTELGPARDADPAGHLALRHAHPRWVISAVADALGAGGRADWDEVEAALAANNAPPRVTLVARPGRATVDDLVATGAQAAPYSRVGAILPGGDPGGLALVRSGAAGVQDEGSQLVTLALADAPLDGPDARWLDLCAGPGGKAALLAGLAGERGARLVAAEVAPHRARLVAAALGSERAAAPVVADGRAPAWPADTFDRVLVDAPCTGLGALRRRPESRWRREPGDVGRLFDLQRELLLSAIGSARPGGLIAYVTCSPHPGETRGVVAAAVADSARAGRPVEPVDARPLLPGVPDLADGPHVQLWPHRHGTDAMFLALLRRV